MKKDKTIQPSPWGDDPIVPDTSKTKIQPDTSSEILDLEPPVYEALDPIPEATYDLEGLMTDFPTATELQKFVYDQTNIALNLKGRANKLKYQIALETLNGKQPDSKFLTNENPYVDKNDMVPEEPFKSIPQRDQSLPDHGHIQNSFFFGGFPHPSEEYRSQDKKVHCIFRKYDTGAISYEVLGPIEPKAVGEKIDKYGKQRPELMTWVDPRTGEQLVQRPDGSVTPRGARIKAFMQKQRIWDQWIDREFASVSQAVIDNPWGN